MGEDYNKRKAREKAIFAELELLHIKQLDRDGINVYCVNPALASKKENTPHDDVQALKV